MQVRAQREEWARVLDWLPSGRPTQAAREPLIQVIGEARFTLLELIVKPGSRLEVGERINVRGADARIERVLRRISYEELTAAARGELPSAVKAIVAARERDFVDWLNRAGALSVRCHALGLLPNVGRKGFASLLGAREAAPFTNFADVDARAALVASIVDILAQRVLEELRGPAKYYLFVKPPTERERA